MGSPARSPCQYAVTRHQRWPSKKYWKLLMPRATAVASSNAVATLSEHLARRLAAPLSLTLHPAPLALPRQHLSLLWHERTQADAAQRWLREQVREAAAELGGD